MSDDDRETREFHQYAAAAVDISSAHVSESGMLTVLRSVRDWDNKCRQNYLYHRALPPPGDLDKPCSPCFPPTLLDKSIQLRLPSPSGRRLMLVKSDTSVKVNDQTPKAPLLEIWEDDSLVRRIQIPNNLHRKIINDPTGFGIPTWSPDETCVLYTAERVKPTTTTFWDTTSTTHNDQDSPVIRGGQHVLGQGISEEWGEKYNNQSPLLDLYIINVTTSKMERILNVPTKYDKTSTSDGLVLGQPTWHPYEQKVTYTAWDAGQLGTMPRRLGMIFCRNRPSQIYVSAVKNLLTRIGKHEAEEEAQFTGDGDNDSDSICVTPDFVLSRSPQYVVTGADEDSSGTASLIFLANPKGFVSHDGCIGLYRWEGDSSQSSIQDSLHTIVPVVDIPWNDQPLKVQGMGFPGLFLSQLSSDLGIGSNYIVTSTSWGSLIRIVRINIITGNIQLVAIPEATPLSSQSVLCKTPTGGLLVSEVALNQPARIWLIDKESLLSSADSDKGVIIATKAKLVSAFSSISSTSFSPVQPKFVPPINFEMVSIKPPSIDGATNESIQALVLIPKKASPENKVPLVVIPHGGPHSCTVSNYAPGFAYLASHYAVVFPNYRGSTGFGQSALESLLTRVGHVDVQDVMSCADHVINLYKDVIDSTKIGICGGSHGGFLAAHCTGQYPDYFQAAVMRNPVTNIATMTTATDIADWCHAECLGFYDFTKFRGPTQDQLTKMYEKSPIVHVDNVKTPTLVALGMVDLRVPPSQGKEWYHTLRSSGIDVQLLVYPEDAHALDRVTTEADHWIHIQQWFDKYFQK